MGRMVGTNRACAPPSFPGRPILGGPSDQSRSRMRTLPPSARIHVGIVVGGSVSALVLLPWTGAEPDRLGALAVLFVVFGAVARARLGGLCGAPDGVLFPLVCAGVLLLPAGPAAAVV